MLTPKMRAELDEEINQAARQLFLSGKICEICKEEATPKQAEFLLHVLQEELQLREQNKRHRLVKRAGFPVYKTFEGYSYQSVKLPPAFSREELENCQFIEKKENLVLYGPVGVGKTHLAVALGIIAAQNRFCTYYISCHNLIAHLNKAHFENRLQERLKNFARYKVLIIDEIGYLPMDIQGANLFFQLITKRYEKSSTILTSNKAFSAWNEVFSDITIASAILDRVLHHCQVVNIKGESYRLKERKELIRQKQQVMNTVVLTSN